MRSFVSCLRSFDSFRNCTIILGKVPWYCYEYFNVKLKWGITDNNKKEIEAHDRFRNNSNNVAALKSIWDDSFEKKDVSVQVNHFSGNRAKNETSVQGLQNVKYWELSFAISTFAPIPSLSCKKSAELFQLLCSPRRTASVVNVVLSVLSSVLLKLAEGFSKQPSYRWYSREWVRSLPFAREL